MDGLLTIELEQVHVENVSEMKWWRRWRTEDNENVRRGLRIAVRQARVEFLDRSVHQSFNSKRREETPNVSDQATASAGRC